MILPLKTPLPRLNRNTAYEDGFKNGTNDARVGVRSEYAWNGVNDRNCYTYEYSRGYREGWTQENNRKAGA